MHTPSKSQSGRRVKRPDLLGPRELAGMANLELVARGVVEGFLIGLHNSPYRGFSVEFAENRPYNPGDDIRFVDWKMWGRSDRYYVKQFEEETNLRAYMLLDISHSMQWVSDPQRLVSKIEYARMLAASLGLLLLRQGDAVGVITFNDRVRDHLQPRSARQHWHRVLGVVGDADAAGTTEAAAAIRDVAMRLQRRGLVILISDLLVTPDVTRTALSYLRHRGHEVLVFHLMDPGERDLPSTGDAVYFDPETGEELLTNSAALRRRYREAVDRATRSWVLDAARIGAEYHLLTTDIPLGVALRSYLDKRARLG
jgi:uncharacterized protein (DUF58 family)